MSSERRVNLDCRVAGWPAAERRRVEFVLTDIDDTLTLHGRLPAVAYAALERLARGGLQGDSDHRAAGRLVRSHRADVAGRGRGRRERRVLVPARLQRGQACPPLPGRRCDATGEPVRLEALAARILAEVPGCALASDQLYREADLAIDFCEDVRTAGRRRRSTGSWHCSRRPAARPRSARSTSTAGSAATTSSP